MTAALNINHTFPNNTRKNIYKSALASLYEKKKIWNKLNEDRLLRQKEKELDKARLHHKKLYAIYGKKYYKLIGEYGDYYVLEDALKNLPSSQFVIQVNRYSFSGMRTSRAVLKIDKSTNKMFLSEDTLRVYFKPYEIESIKYNPRNT
ncbi:MAG TPA: hypothetical protein ENK98_03655 [Epsilonproteobacteria bacterium]|nr:hypothetical protein [Campylobacterota bacterium]